MSDRKETGPKIRKPEVTPVRHGDIDLPEELPLVGIDNFVLFPFMIAPLVFTRDHDKALVDEVLKGERLMGVVLKKDPALSDTFDNLHEVGTLSMVLKMLKMPDGAVRLLLHGIDRIRIAKSLSEEPFLRAKVERLEGGSKATRPVKAMMKKIQSLIGSVVAMGQLPEDLGAAVSAMSDPGKLADLAVSHLPVKMEKRQEILQIADLEERLHHVLEIVTQEVDLMKLGTEIQTQVTSEVDKHQRDYMLREQLKVIKKELGEDDVNPEFTELAETIKKTKMPDYARETAEKELKRLKVTHPSSPEYSVGRNYLDWIVSLPWEKKTRDNIDIKKAQKVLDEDHYALEDIKEKILEYLAVLQLKKEIRGPILCFVGPPGVGKTSLGRSIARAMGRKFYRMSLGGMRDEAEIRGHRRTYIGSLPGRILKGIKDCGSNNPLIMLDEIDKLGKDFRGDPASALLEVLDPEQNHNFTDHYLDMPFDLSGVMFITTANYLDAIPSPLRDRMEVLRLSGYTTREKVEIAKRYLVPRSFENTGVSKKHITFTDEGLLEIIEGYTRESGVRNVEREIGNICRKVAKAIALKETDKVTITPPKVRNYLGPWRMYYEMADRAGQPGVAIGLAWSPSGGAILFIEASNVPGNGQLLLTGQLGDVMKESAMAAMNFLHANAKRLNIPEKSFSTQNFHIHVPAGATPKDGPSAGITIATAICSLLTNNSVKEKLAMTGEVTLKGNVLPVGGIKEKVLAAHRSGIKEIILPARCKDELNKDVPKEVSDSIRFHFVDHINQVIDIALPNGKRTQKQERISEPAQVPEKSPPPPPVEKKSPSKPPEKRGRIAAGAPILPPTAAQAVARPPLRIEPDPRNKPRHRTRRRGSDSQRGDSQQVASTTSSAQDQKPPEQKHARSAPPEALKSSEKEPRRRTRGRRGSRKESPERTSPEKFTKPASGRTSAPAPAPAKPASGKVSDQAKKPVVKPTPEKPPKSVEKPAAKPAAKPVKKSARFTIKPPQEETKKAPVAAKTAPPKPSSRPPVDRGGITQQEKDYSPQKPTAAKKPAVKKPAASAKKKTAATRKTTPAKMTVKPAKKTVKKTAKKKTVAKKKVAKKKTVAKKTSAKKKTAVKKTSAKKKTTAK